MSILLLFRYKPPPSVLAGRELYADHRQRFMIPEERVLELAGFRLLMLFAEKRELEICASERKTELMAGDRELELIADEEKTW